MAGIKVQKVLAVPKANFKYRTELAVFLPIHGSLGVVLHAKLPDELALAPRLHGNCV